MIIESLYNHYLEEVAKGNPLYPPQGMELKRIHFVMVISSDGTLVDIEQLEETMHVVRSRQRAGRNACHTPNYMWDSVGYVVGVDGTEAHHDSFRAMVRVVCEQHPDNPTFQAVRNFYYRGVEQLQSHPLWHKMTSKNDHNLTFRLLGEAKTAAQQSELITPSSKETALSHPKIYINGAAGTGAKLVSYGRNSGYESYGLKAGENASIPTDVAEGYTAAITALRQMNGVGNRVISLSANYFRRIPRQGTQVYLKKLFAQVIDKIATDGVPKHLSLEDQGRFALGYQHQHQSFYIKKDDEQYN